MERGCSVVAPAPGTQEALALLEKASAMEGGGRDVPFSPPHFQCSVHIHPPSQAFSASRRILSSHYVRG